MQMTMTLMKPTNKRDIVRACVNVNIRAKKKIENNINNNNRKKKKERKIQLVEKKRDARRQTNKRKKEILCLYTFRLENRR